MDQPNPSSWDTQEEVICELEKRIVQDGCFSSGFFRNFLFVIFLSWMKRFIFHPFSNGERRLSFLNTQHFVIFYLLSEIFSSLNVLILLSVLIVQIFQRKEKIGTRDRTAQYTAFLHLSWDLLHLRHWKGLQFLFYFLSLFLLVKLKTSFFGSTDTEECVRHCYAIASLLVADSFIEQKKFKESLRQVFSHQSFIRTFFEISFFKISFFKISFFKISFLSA